MCTNISLCIVPITHHNYTIDAIPPVNPSLGNGARKGKNGRNCAKEIEGWSR